MPNDDYILFEHNLTIFDLKNQIKMVAVLLLLFCFCAFGLFFKIDSLAKIPFLVENLYLFSIVIGILLVISCAFLRLETFAKIILTEDKIIYKPPVLFRIYEMEYSCVKSFCYANCALVVEGEKGQKLSVYLTKNTADKIIDILQREVIC